MAPRVVPRSDPGTDDTKTDPHGPAFRFSQAPRLADTSSSDERRTTWIEKRGAQTEQGDDAGHRVVAAVEAEDELVDVAGAIRAALWRPRQDLNPRPDG